MRKNTISFKTVEELFGMYFFIPDYQRGYRWEKQQAIDLLQDIYAFICNTPSDSEEIYCIQSLVVSEKTEDILAKCKSQNAALDDINKYIKGSWNVVDGHQRLTTIYLMLSCLGVNDKYEIDYSTRNGSKNFLLNIQSKEECEAACNPDYYHMYLVYSTIKDWLEKKDEMTIAKMKSTLLKKVNFIWYQVDEVDEVAVFTRLNTGKIPLTDSERIKALFLNRSNFVAAKGTSRREIEIIQNRIAAEWDEIEQALQNDDFWTFIHGPGYEKSTRMDFIFDSICKKDCYKLFLDPKKYRITSKHNYREYAENYNKLLDERIGNDEHRTFRYFNEAFRFMKNDGNLEWIDRLWSEVRINYQVLNELYNDNK